MNWICTLAPGQIVLGGGLMRTHLFPLIRERLRVLLNGYFDMPELKDGLDRYIVPSSLNSRASC